MKSFNKYLNYQIYRRPVNLLLNINHLESVIGPVGSYLKCYCYTFANVIHLQKGSRSFQFSTWILFVSEMQLLNSVQFLNIDILLAVPLGIVLLTLLVPLLTIYKSQKSIGLPVLFGFLRGFLRQKNKKVKNWNWSDERPSKLLFCFSDSWICHFN